jgi:hypothetical protein
MLIIPLVSLTMIHGKWKLKQEERPTAFENRWKDIVGDEI